MGSTTDDEASFLCHALTSTIYRHQVVVATALDVKRNLRRIIDNDRTDIQAMGSHRSQAEATALRNNDRTTIGKIISCGTCRGRDDETIGLVSNQELTIHHRSDRNHGGVITLQYGDVVEGKWITSQHTTLRFHLDDGMLLYLAFTGIETVQRRLYLTRQDIRKEAQASHIDADDRSTLGTHTARRLEEGTITTHGDDVIDIEVVVLEDSGDIQLQMLVTCQEVIIGTFHIHLSPTLVEIIEDDFDGSRLLGLVFIAKYGEFQMLLCHLFCSFNYYYYFCKRETRGALLYCI